MSDGDFQIEIDGRTVAANRGEMIIHVADREGIFIPRFCYHEKLSIAANCRMCLVEVERAPKPLPACATPVMDGMKVQTQSDYARQAQKSVMEFLLINHPLMPICDRGGECELQDLAMGYGDGVSRFSERKRVVKDKNLNFDRDGHDALYSLRAAFDSVKKSPVCRSSVRPGAAKIWRSAPTSRGLWSRRCPATSSMSVRLGR